MYDMFFMLMAGLAIAAILAVPALLCVLAAIFRTPDGSVTHGFEVKVQSPPSPPDQPPS